MDRRTPNFFLMVLGWIGLFRYKGLRGREPQWWPRARVQYDDGEVSHVMAIGDAIDYASMFKGKVIRP